MAKQSKPQKAGLTRRQLSRAQRESRLQRGVIIGVIVVAVLITGLMIFAVLNELVIKPGRVLISVNGETVSVREFQERVKFEYYLQTGGQPLEQVGMTPQQLGEYFIENMITEMLIAQKAEELGVEASEAEVREEIELAFGYDSGEPEPTVTPRPTSVPVTPTVTPTFVFTLTPLPTATLAPGVTPTITPTPSPTPAGTLTPTPTRTPVPTATPVSEEAYTQSYNEFVQGLAEGTGLPLERVEELLFERARAVVLRRNLFAALDFTVDETKPMVHVAHILVATEEEARAVLERINAGEEFETLAAELSLDTSNAYKGGDLGWFGRGRMVAPFEEAAFALEVGAISEPVETEFGWHIIKKYDEDLAVPTTEAEREQQRQQQFSEALARWREEATIEIDEAWISFMPELP